MGKKITEILSDANRAILHQIDKQDTNRNAVARRARIPRSSFDRRVDGDGHEWSVKELGQVAEALGMQFPEVLLKSPVKS